MIFLLLLAGAISAHIVTAAYTLADSFNSANFDSEFTHFTYGDPNGGFAQFVDDTTAVNTGLKYLAPDSIYLGVDHTKVYSKGRRAVRVSSNKAYNHGLFIADVAHLPSGICGVWPALWLLGQKWPQGGEIDMVEGINLFEQNYMTAHTSNYCSISKTGFSGTAAGLDCNERPKNRGCAIVDSSKESFGKGFNNIGGGVYALEWTSSAIKTWFFPRYAIPSDITAGKPKPSTWGTPSAKYAGNCDIDSNFQDMQLVISTTFCGAWAGAQWHYQCADKAPTCEEYVGKYPGEFQNAFWKIKSIKVYKLT